MANEVAVLSYARRARLSKSIAEKIAAFDAVLDQALADLRAEMAEREETLRLQHAAHCARLMRAGEER